MSESIWDPSHTFLRGEFLTRSDNRSVYKSFDQDNCIDSDWVEISLQNVKEERIQKLIEYLQVLLSHPHQNIIKLYTCWIDKRENPHFVFISEQFTSQTIRKYISEVVRNPSRSVISKWCHQILDGLEHLHSTNPPIQHNLIHCDNLFIDPSEGIVKLGVPDFDILIHGNVFPLSAPEVHNGLSQIKSDVWLLGLSVIEMATSVNPYSEFSTAKAQTMEIISGKLPTALSRVADPTVADFITNCLLPVGQRPTVTQLREFALIADSKDYIPSPRSHEPETGAQLNSINNALNDLLERQKQEVSELKKRHQEARWYLRKNIEQKSNSKRTFRELLEESTQNDDT